MAKLSSTHIFGNLVVDGNINGNADTASKVNNGIKIQLNGGTAENTSQFTFDGSTTKNINITPSSIGAATTSTATTSANGLMSSTDKSKLNGIAANANNYLHPTYTSKTSGLYKVTVDGTGHVSATTPVTKADITGLGIPGSDTTYSVATTSTNGLMSSTDKSKLDGIATNANNYSHPTTSGNKHIPSGGSSGQILRWSADGTAVWGNDNNTTYSTGTASASGLTKLYTGAGTATDGTMTQAAIKTALDGKANSSHIHNSLMATDLSSLTVSLNDYNLSSGTPKVAYYFCPSDGNGSNITGRPNDSDKKAFNLVVESLRFVSNTDYITKQTYTQGSQKIIYVRYCTNGTWTAWEKVYTSTQKPTLSELGAASTAAATTSANGLMTSAMVTKLNGIATNANNYSHPTTSGNKHIPAGGSSGQILRWSADGTAVWGADNNTTYSTGTTSTAGLTKLYTGTGTATDGTMTQSAITTAINNAISSNSNVIPANSTITAKNNMSIDLNNEFADIINITGSGFLKYFWLTASGSTSANYGLQIVVDGVTVHDLTGYITNTTGAGVLNSDTIEKASMTSESVIAYEKGIRYKSSLIIRSWATVRGQFTNGYITYAYTTDPE